LRPSGAWSLPLGIFVVVVDHHMLFYYTADLVRVSKSGVIIDP